MMTKILIALSLVLWHSCTIIQGCDDVYPVSTCIRVCKRYPNWSAKNCKKTCGYCVGPTAQPSPAPPSGSCGVSTFQQSRVIGGVDAKRGSWPWQIALLYNGRFGCGGSLITPEWIVTAAHCVHRKSSNSFSVVLGEHNRNTREGSEQTIRASRVIAHPDYNKQPLNNDVALIKLSRPATLNNYVKTVCLPDQGIDIPVGSTCYITGWGKIRHPGSAHPMLQQSPLRVVSQSTCGRLNNKVDRSGRLKITRKMVCAGFGPNDRRGGCHGDSGGPFVCQQSGKWFLHGAVSWGSSECTTTKAYSVFSRLSEFRAWIDRSIN